MPNWCFNQTTIYGEKEMLEKFKTDLVDALSENPKFEKVENDWNNMWLGNIFLGAGYEEKDLGKSIRCRGWVDDYIINENKIELQYETAWDDICSSIDKMLEEKYGGVLYQVTLAEEIGNEFYLNTDKEKKYYKTEFCITTDEKIFDGEDKYFDSKEELLNFFNTRLKENFTTIEEIEDWLSDFDGYCNLHYFQ